MSDRGGAPRAAGDQRAAGPTGDGDRVPGRAAARPPIPPWNSDHKPGADSPAAPEGERLQKVMAAAGIASRRVSENLIAAGRVAVNGQLVTEPGRRVTATDRVEVDGVPIQLDVTKRYLMLNKPVGVVSSMADEQGRRDLREFTRDLDERLFNVGRLDAATSGLLILTNDGELANVLAHPRFGVMKTYVAKVSGAVSAQTIARLTKGIELEDGPIAADKARALPGGGPSATLVELTLHSGRNRIVRRMMDAVGHPVLELVRRQFGPLTLGALPVGRTRELTQAEVGQLLALVRDAENPAASPSRAPRRAAPTEAAAPRARAASPRPSTPRPSERSRG